MLWFIINLLAITCHSKLSLKHRKYYIKINPHTPLHPHALLKMRVFSAILLVIVSIACVSASPVHLKRSYGVAAHMYIRQSADAAGYRRALVEAVKRRPTMNSPEANGSAEFGARAEVPANADTGTNVGEVTVEGGLHSRAEIGATDDLADEEAADLEARWCHY
ncbi:hypothetical protein APHAL10511_000328 [Amanita phalloides]|nr:hypothetical protein APHAL10511_000328 [Amanita phalloides]